MAAEFYIVFSDIPYYMKNREEFMKIAEALPTFAKKIGFDQLWLKSRIITSDTWAYDARMFFQPTSILLEIDGNRADIHADLKAFAANTRSKQNILIVDDDGENIDFFD